MRNHLRLLLVSLALLCLCAIAPAAVSAEGIQVVEEYDFSLPDGVQLALTYNRYEAFLHYFVASKSTHVLAAPQDGAQTLQSLNNGMRLYCDAKVLGADASEWFRVKTADGTVGYIRANQGSHRTFAVQEGYARLLQMEQYADDPFTVMIQNYKNKQGKAPALGNGSTKDSRGYPNDQAAPAYEQPEPINAVCYLPDGLILVRYESFNNMTRVYSPTWDAFYWVPDKYLTRGDALTALNQVCIVNVPNQNVILFERNAQGGWEIAALSFVSTGATYAGARETPEGDYRVVETRKKFVFDNDNDKIYDGYAMWATRFSCGAYLHSASTGYRYDPVVQGDMSTIPDNVPEGGLTSLGTKPQSHMCVRNYTSFAKYLYDRITPTEAMVLVMGRWAQ